MHLQQNLPFDITIPKCAQFLHPEKRNNPGSTSGFSNLVLKVTKALEITICKTFQVPQSDSREQVCHKIRTQWIAYQLKDIPKEFYTKSNDEVSKSFRRTNSYWSYARELSDFQPILETDLQFIRIDHYWRKIGKILSDDGLQKYTHLICLIKCILSLSHRNSTPEQGFSMKDEACRIAGVTNFPISRELISSVKIAHSKYVAHLEM